MSWTTGTQAELLASNITIPSAYATFTSAEYIGPAVATNSSAYLPANFFMGVAGVGKTLNIKANGYYKCTATPTLVLGISLNTTSGTYNGSGILAQTPTMTLSSGVTGFWSMDVLATCTGTGSSGTFLASGPVVMYSAVTTATAWNFGRCSSSTADPNTALTISTDVAYYVELFAAYGSSSASNQVNVYNVAVLGLN